MASDGYWKTQFLAGAVDVVAAEILSKDFFLEQFLQSKGTHWLANKARAERKEAWAEPVVLHMGLVHGVVDRLSKLQGMLDHVIMEGLGVKMTEPGPRFDDAIGRYLDDGMEADFPRLWSYNLQNKLNDLVGSAIIRGHWYKSNYKELINQRRKIAMVGGIMDS